MGMRRMQSRGLMTEKECRVLKKTPVPATQRHNAVLMWILRAVIDGRKAGHIDGGFGFEQQMMSKIQEIRAQANSMESILRGRMPFAYHQIVQLLINSILWMYPLMAFSKDLNMSFHLGVFGMVLLTSSYQGLFDLAKQLLDPFHNENFWKGQDALVVDTLIAETNAGSMRWMFCLDEMPISYESIRKGSLDEFILPDEGFSKEDADAAYQEREEMKRREIEDGKKYAVLRSQRFNMTDGETYEERLLKELEAVQEELESTKLILNAPPGSDFVPGLDDKNETVAYDSDIDKPSPEKRRRDEDVSETGFESFIDAAEGEKEEKEKELLGRSGRGELYVLGSKIATNHTTSVGDKFLNY